MDRSLVRLTIKELVVHEVPQARKRDPGAEPLRLSDVPVRLKTDQRRYLQERLISALGDHRRDVVEDASAGSPVPGWIKDLLAAPAKDCVPTSRDLALHLREVQRGVSPSGLFLMARCTWDADAALLVAKVELEQGVRAHPTQLDSGEMTYDMEVIRDLVFGETSRIYKVGLFAAHDIREDDGLLRGIVIDRQKGGPSVTAFFLFEYLGCQYAADPAEQTRRYYEAARDFLNSAVTDPQRRAEYVVALVADLGSKKGEVSPRAFARDHLDEGDQHPFLAALAAKGVPQASFHKATTFVATEVLRYETEAGVVVVAGREQVESGILDVKPNKITVNDRLSKIATQGHRGPRRTSDNA